MNRDDWVFVGMRLLGLYELVEATVALPTVIAGSWNVPGANLLGPVLSWGLSAVLGAGLFVGAPYVAAWLRRKDPAVEPG